MICSDVENVFSFTHLSIYTYILIKTCWRVGARSSASAYASYTYIWDAMTVRHEIRQKACWSLIPPRFVLNAELFFCISCCFSSFLNCVVVVVVRFVVSILISCHLNKSMPRKLSSSLCRFLEFNAKANLHQAIFFSMKTTPTKIVIYIEITKCFESIFE